MDHFRSSAMRAMLDAAIVLTAAFTAGVHIYLAVEPTTLLLRVSFVLAAAGFLGGLAARFVLGRLWPPMRPLGRLALVATALSTIVGYFVVMGFVWDPLAVASKIDEALLILLLVADALVATNVLERPQAQRSEELESKKAA